MLFTLPLLHQNPFSANCGKTKPCIYVWSTCVPDSISSSSPPSWKRQPCPWRCSCRGLTGPQRTHRERPLGATPGHHPADSVSTSRRPGPPGPPKARGHKSGSTSSPWQGQSSPIQGDQETAPVGLGVREHPTQIYFKHHSASAPSLDCADKHIMAERRFVEQQA